jgi:type II secretory pathway component PulJ
MSMLKGLTRSGRRADAGYLLIEVLVAVAVSTILLVMLTRSFSTSWRNQVHEREEVEAIVVANGLMERLSPRSSLRAGAHEGQSGRYAWRATVGQSSLSDADLARNTDGTPLAGLTTRPGSHWALYRIIVEVRAPSGRRTVVETLRLGATTPR